MRSGISFRAPAMGSAIRAGISVPAIAAALVALAACAREPVPMAGPHPADPQVRVPPAAYRSITGGYASQRPVEPRPWTEQNQRVTPAPKQ